MEPEGLLPHWQEPSTVPILSRINPVHFSNSTFRWAILILSSHLSPDLPSGLFTLRFSTKTLYTTHQPPYVLHAPPISLFLIVTRIQFSDEHKPLSSPLCSFLHSRCLVPLGTKYSLQHPTLKKPQPTFLPQCQRPSFTPIQNKAKCYNLQHITSVTRDKHLTILNPLTPNDL
jgi:hypothetical protein